VNVETLWALLVKGSLVVAFAGLATLFLRRASGARRHVVWLAAVTALLLLPLAELRLPRWRVSPEAAPIVRPLVAPRPFRTPVPLPRPKVALSPVVASSLSASGPAPEPTPAPLDRGVLLARLWLVGCLAFVLWSLVGMLRVWALIRSGRPWSPHVALDHRRCVRALLCPDLRVPATAGFFRPVLLLPEAAPEWDAARLRMVVAHEMAHVRRGDWLWQTLAQFACALHFFNPLVWIAARRLRGESETACDDLVLGTGVEPTAYAQTLLDLAKGARKPLANVVGMAHRPQVEGRLRAIVDARRSRLGVSGKAHTSALALAAVLGALVGVVHAAPDLLASIRQGRKPNWPSPPSIPWVASTEVEPNVYLAQDGVAGLPNGVKLRLVGVAVPQNDEFWDMKGTTLPDAGAWSIGSPFWQGSRFHDGGAVIPDSRRFNAFTRKFVLEIESGDDRIAATCGEIVRPARTTELQRLNRLYSGSDVQLNTLPLTAGMPRYGIIELAIPARSDTADYRVGIAGGEWTKRATVEVSPVGSPDDRGGGLGRCGVNLDDAPSLFYEDAKGAYQSRALLSKGEKLDETVARRVVLYDRNDAVIPLPPSRPTSDGVESLMVSAETFVRIAKVELYTSPYRFVEFRNVPLRPDYAAETARRLGGGTKGTAKGVAPGFSKRLKNGATVSLIGVVKAKRDGEFWKFTGPPAWRGDGAVLAISPDAMNRSLPIDPYGTLPLYEFFVQYDHPGRDVSIRTVATGAIDRSFWLDGQLPSSYANGAGPLDWATVPYLPTAKTGGLRAGIATGPWRTIARVPIDVARLPATDEGSKAKHTGVEFTFDPLPTLAFLESGKIVKLAAQPIGEVARRFVAITKTGERRVLRPYASGPKGMDVFGLAARTGELRSGYNGLLASDVKEILLQTRPFEWVEFRGIPLEHK